MESHKAKVKVLVELHFFLEALGLNLLPSSLGLLAKCSSVQLKDWDSIYLRTVSYSRSLSQILKAFLIIVLHTFSDQRWQTNPSYSSNLFDSSQESSHVAGLGQHEWWVMQHILSIAKYVNSYACKISFYHVTLHSYKVKGLACTHFWESFCLPHLVYNQAGILSRFQLLNIHLSVKGILSEILEDF